MIHAGDVSEQLDAQRRIEDSERRYCELFEQSPMAIWEQDWSLVRVRLDALGIDDLADHLQSNLDLVRELCLLRAIRDMNDAAMSL